MTAGSATFAIVTERHIGEVIAVPSEAQRARAQRLGAIQPAMIVAPSAIRWSLAQGGPIVARGPSTTGS